MCHVPKKSLYQLCQNKVFWRNGPPDTTHIKAFINLSFFFIQRAKKPAIMATTTATSQFATKEYPAAVEAVGVAVRVALLEVAGMLVELVAVAVVVLLRVPLVAAPEAVPVAAGEVNETGLGVTLGPVTERPARGKGGKELIANQKPKKAE